MEIIVVGAGTGGLCLANGLRDAGVNVRVFERDDAQDQVDQSAEFCPLATRSTERNETLLIPAFLPGRAPPSLTLVEVANLVSIC